MSKTGSGVHKRNPTDEESTETADETTATRTEGGPNNPEDLWETLSNKRRRWVIGQLVTAEDVDIGFLSTHRAAVENDCATSEITSDQRKRVYIGLYQCHLPTLDNAGVVDWDKRTQTVQRGPEFVRAHNAIEAVEGALDTDSESEQTSDGFISRLAGAVGGLA